MGIIRRHKVLIVARTNMNNNHICVGAYCLDTKKNIRLLDNRARALDVSEPYKVGQIYKIEYQTRYNLIPPHIEDVVVYFKAFVRKPEKNEFLHMINQIAVPLNNVLQLFENKLDWINGRGFIVENNIPSCSVMIAKLGHDLVKSSEYFECFDKTSNTLYKIKYVGDLKLPESMILHAGTPIRFSLARFWNGYSSDSNAVKRAYLQISGWYY